MTECLGKFFMKNGQLLEATLFDESFLSKPHYIYEVFRVIDGLPLFIEDHLERLKQTIELSGLPAEMVPADFEQQVQRLIEANALQEGNIKVVMLSADNDQEAAFLIYIMEHQYPSPSEFENGVELALHYGIRENPNAKVMDVELRSNTNTIKKTQHVYETLLVDQDRCITEGSRSNVFFVRGDELITPPLADVLPGVTRKHVMKLCGDLIIPLREEKVHEDSLAQMDAVFITGTSRKVLPAFRIDEWLYPPDHPIVRQLQAAFNQEVENYLQSKKA